MGDTLKTLYVKEYNEAAVWKMNLQELFKVICQFQTIFLQVKSLCYEISELDTSGPICDAGLRRYLI